MKNILSLPDLKSKPLRKKSHKVVDLIGRNFYLSGQSFTMIYQRQSRLYPVVIH